MESVATSMTNHIRSVSTVTVPGQIGHGGDLYPRPVGPANAAGRFDCLFRKHSLLWTMLETRHKKAEVWKDSSLALIFHGLGKEGESREW